MKWDGTPGLFAVVLPADVASVRSLSEHAVYTPVTRCIECENFDNDANHGAWCNHFMRPLHDDYDGFCAWGKTGGTMSRNEAWDDAGEIMDQHAGTANLWVYAREIALRTSLTRQDAEGRVLGCVQDALGELLYEFGDYGKEAGR